MGTFNLLCCASQQVIQCGDRCFVLPIIQQSSYEPLLLNINGKSFAVPGVSKHNCYPDCQWTWLGNFLEARYTNRCEFELVDNVANQVRMFLLAHTLFEKSAVVRPDLSAENEEEMGIDERFTFDFKSFVFDKHPDLHVALQAAEPTYESDWRVVMPTNLPDLFASLQAAFTYLYRSAFFSTVYVPASNQNKAPSPVQLAVIHGVVFDKLVAHGENEKGTTREFFEEQLSTFFKKDEAGTSSLVSKVREFFQSQLAKLFDFDPYQLHRLVNMIQQCLYFAPHGQHGEYEEVSYGIKANGGANVSLDAAYEAVRPVIEARFALNAMGREHLFLSPLRICGDEGNCYGEEYAQFIDEASAAVKLARPVHW